MKKSNKIGFVIAVISMTFIGIFVAISWREHCMQKEIASEILRFHVLANSDSAKDQERKLQVKNAVSEYLRPLLENTHSKEEAMKCIKNHLYNIEETAQKIVDSQQITASLETDWFPAITYGDCTFPAGIYDTLTISIGEAKGHNWWCVLYPGLCFSGSVKPVVTSQDKNLLKNVLDEECYNFLLRPAKTKIRFRLFGLEFFRENR